MGNLLDYIKYGIINSVFSNIAGYFIYSDKNQTINKEEITMRRRMVVLLAGMLVMNNLEVNATMKQEGQQPTSREIVYTANSYSILREENGYSLFRSGHQLANIEYSAEISETDFARGYTLTSEGKLCYINFSTNAKNNFLDIVEVDDDVARLQGEFCNADYSIPVYLKGGQYYVALPNDPIGHKVYNGGNSSHDEVADYDKESGYTTVKLGSNRLIAYLEYLDTEGIWKRHYKLVYKGISYGELVADSSITNNFLNDVIDFYYNENPENRDLRWNTFVSLIACEEIEEQEAKIQEFMNSWAEQHRDYVWETLDKCTTLSNRSEPMWGAEDWKQNHPRQQN